jgi:hypothetical protein
MVFLTGENVEGVSMNDGLDSRCLKNYLACNLGLFRLHSIFQIAIPCASEFIMFGSIHNVQRLFSILFHPLLGRVRGAGTKISSELKELSS